MEGISMRFHRFFVCCWLALTLLPRQEGYITMSNIAFVPFSCFSHPYGGSSLLTTTNILCGSGDHGFMQVYGVILGTLPWSVVFFFLRLKWLNLRMFARRFLPSRQILRNTWRNGFPLFCDFPLDFPQFFQQKKNQHPRRFEVFYARPF